MYNQIFNNTSFDIYAFDNLYTTLTQEYSMCVCPLIIYWHTIKPLIYVPSYDIM